MRIPLVAAAVSLVCHVFPVDGAINETGTVASSTNAAPKRRTAMEAVGGFVVKPVPKDAKCISVHDTRMGRDEAPEKFAKAVMSAFQLAVRIGEPQKGDVAIILADEGEAMVFLDKPEAIVTGGATEDETVGRLMSALLRIIGIEGDKFGLYLQETAMRQASAMGLSQAYRTTYKKAVQEGWAHTPTNEFQQAIWDSIH